MLLDRRCWGVGGQSF